MRCSMKKFISILLVLSVILSFSGCFGNNNSEDDSNVTYNESATLLAESTWSEDVKDAVNDLIINYGNKSENYNENSYVVFDFDNTTAVFDVSEQFMDYILNNMCFGFKPEEIKDVLSSGLSDLNKDLTSYGYGKGSYNSWLNDLEKAYTYLYNTYGPFSSNGISAEKSAEMIKDDMWVEFAAKIRTMHSLISDVDSTTASCPWDTYWYSGLTEKEVYDLSYKSHKYYQNKDTQSYTLTTSADIDSGAGVVTAEYTTGVSVTPNNVELYKVLAENGFDVWVCSASHIDVICSAVDAYGLRDYVTGVIGMTTVTDENGKLTNQYDFETGYAKYPQEDGSWKNGTVPINAQSQEYGKVESIDHILVTEYGCGPIAGFGDSSGDFNFCTEYKDMKLSIVYNRANRKVTDGGGLLAEIAMYQKDTLKYDLATANANGDTLYVLQGRDENGTRAFLSGNETLRLGESETKLFCDENNEAQLQYMIDNKLSTADAINTFAMLTAKNDNDNKLGFEYGFLNDYNGYHSH